MGFFSNMLQNLMMRLEKSKKDKSKLDSQKWGFEAYLVAAIYKVANITSFHFNHDVNFISRLAIEKGLFFSY